MEELRALGVEPAVLDLERPAESGVWDGRYAAAVYAVAPGPGDPELAFRHGPLECARRLLAAPAPPRFIFISSTGVYRESSGGWVDEETPAAPSEERLWSLVEGEDGIRQLAATEGLPAVILRLAGLYGPKRSPFEWLRRPEMIARITRSARDGWMNWIRIEDAAAATVLAIEKGLPGAVYQASDGTPVIRSEFYGHAARLAGIALPQFAAGGDLGKRLSIQKISTELGFAPRFPSYREGLEDLLRR